MNARRAVNYNGAAATHSALQTGALVTLGDPLLRDQTVTPACSSNVSA